MKSLALVAPGKPLRVLCLGAHSDDIEIGAGATLLGWIAAGVELHVHWVVFSAAGARAIEAQRSAEAFLVGAASTDIHLHTFPDGHFPSERRALKTCFEDLKTRIEPDLILTHHHDDAHQDHRLVAELTGNTFRDHLTLAYEIPKWDGDLGRPTVYIAASETILTRKIELLLAHFATQRSKDWFDAETFRGLARIRGMECRAPDRFAEAFHVRKMRLA